MIILLLLIIENYTPYCHGQINISSAQTNSLDFLKLALVQSSYTSTDELFRWKTWLPDRTDFPKQSQCKTFPIDWKSTQIVIKWYLNQMIAINWLFVSRPMGSKIFLINYTQSGRIFLVEIHLGNAVKCLLVQQATVSSFKKKKKDIKNICK